MPSDALGVVQKVDNSLGYYDLHTGAERHHLALDPYPRVRGWGSRAYASAWCINQQEGGPALMRLLSFLVGVMLLWAMSTLQPRTEASGCLKSGSVYTCTDTGDPVTNGANLQNTVNAASCGDTIVIPTAVEHRNATGTSGNPVVILPNKSCGTNQYVTIQSSATASLPAGTRVTYANLSSMAVLRTMNQAPAIDYANGAGWIKWIGVLFTSRDMSQPPVSFVGTLVSFNDDQSGTAHDIVYDRVIIRPYEEERGTPPSATGQMSVGFGLRLDGANMSLINSTVDGFCCYETRVNDQGGHDVAQSTAIAIVGGPGPFTISNNYIGAWYANLFTGGGGSGPTNTATISRVTNTSAVFSNVTGLQVGSVLRFYFTTPLSNTDQGDCYNNTGGRNHYGAAKVDTINGSTVTWHWLCNWVGKNCPTGTENPDSPGQVGWRTSARLQGFTVTHNTLNKRQSWDGVSQSKTFWEMKEGSNVLFEGNIVTGPYDSKKGNFCALNNSFATNQNATNPWAETKNNTFRSNIFYGGGAIFPGAYNSGCPIDADNAATGIVTTNNLFLSGAGVHARDSFMYNTQKALGHVISHNTVLFAANSIMKGMCGAGICDSTGIVFRDNIVHSGGYFFNPRNAYPGLDTTHNIVIDNTRQCNGNPTSCNGWKPSTRDQIKSSPGAVGFVNQASCYAITGYGSGGDYHHCALAGGSSGHLAASDGTDIGVNFTMLDAALNRSGPESSIGSAVGGGAVPKGK